MLFQWIKKAKTFFNKEQGQKTHLQSICTIGISHIDNVALNTWLTLECLAINARCFQNSF